MSKENNNILNDMKRVYKIIKNYPFHALKTNLSYINRLFPQFHSNASLVLLCINNSDDENIKKVGNYNNDTNTESFLELTGSPLECSYGDDSFDISVIQAKKNWLEIEEKYLPIPRDTGTELINIFLDEIGFDENWNLPIFALCNPAKESTKNVLIGSSCDPEWFMTYEVKISGLESLENIQAEYSQLSEKYSEKSVHNTNVLVTSVYELCGVSPRMINWKKENRRDSIGYLKIEGHWNSLSFFPPLTPYSNKIVAEILSGSTASPLSDLWNQLSILHKYLLIIEDRQKNNLNSRYSVKPLVFPENFDNPYLQNEDNVKKMLSRLLIADDDTEVDNNIEETLLGDANDKEFQLITFVKELSQRQNLDFIDKFWQVVRSVDSYFLMTDCFNEVFESMEKNNFKPELNSMDNTRFAKIIPECFNEEKISLPTESIFLELVIDMGMEKITKDYTYLLSNMNIIDIFDWKKMLDDVSTGKFMVDKYRQKLKTLMQVHVSFEFLALIQSQLYCRYDILQQIFETAFKSLTVPTSIINFSDFTDFQLYTFSMAAPKEFMIEVKDSPPSSWMCTLSTEKKNEKKTATYHYSRMPIFPPNIYIPEEFNKNQILSDEMYHVTTARINYFKYYKSIYSQ